MAVDVIMPQMGESVAEGTVVRWLKQVGEGFERDEVLFEITTDKVDAEIPAAQAGVLLEIRAAEGATVPVGAVVAVIGAAGESVGAVADAPPAIPSSPRQPPQQQPAPERPRSETTAAELRRTRSTPVVRRIAAEHGVELSAIAGTGLDGRVTKKDILAWLERGDAAGPAPSAPRAPQEIPVWDGDRVEPMSPMRRTISDRMIASKQHSAHVHTCWEIDYTRLDGLRRRHKPSYLERGARLTFTAFLARATIEALRAFPLVNSAHDGAQVIYRGAINLGVAVALERGLLVPVIRDADALSMLGLARAIADLGDRARTKRLRPDEVGGLTFSITNPGIFGSQWGTPILPQPTTAILGVGTIERRPRVVTLDGADAIAIRTCGYLTLGFDHRVIDGAVADQFMAHLKRGLETFDEALM